MAINLSRYLLIKNNALFIARYTASPATVLTPYSVHLFVQTILHDEISTLFFKSLENFEPISGQPTDSDLVEICKILSQILLVIPYDEENGIHNLVGLIQDTTTYATDYTTAFLFPKKPADYDASIMYDKKAPIRAKKEAIRKAHLQYLTTY